MAKKLLYGKEARKALENGVLKVANAVRLTLGPRGRNVVLERKYTTPLITNDGVTIARDITLSDPFENLGANLVKEASIKTNEGAGDGTTTATILASSIICEGQRALEEGMSPILLKKGIDKGVKCVVNCLKNASRKIESLEDIKRVATISAADSEIGQIVASAIEKVGRDGSVSLGDSQTAQTSIEVLEGMSFDRGMLSPYMATNPEKMRADLEDAFILITDKKINTISELLPLLEAVMQSGKPLFIIADDIEQDALSALVLNKLRGTIMNVCVKTPLFGEKRKEMLEDIATLTGATLISSELFSSFKDVDISMLGRADKILVTKDKSSIIGGRGDAIKIDSLKNKVREMLLNATDEYDKTRLTERLSKLSRGVAVIKVGAKTEVECAEKKLRCEDALAAVKCSLISGIVAGGGVAFLSSKQSLEALLNTLEGEEKIGCEIILKAIEAPIRQIAENASASIDEILEAIYGSITKEIGYNALDRKFVNMFEAGIIDPTEVEISALENAASVATTVLSTECLVVEEDLAANA